MSIKLGQIVECIVTGFSGTAIQFMEHLNGNIQVAVQPRQKDGEITYPEAMFMDQHMLKVTDSIGVTDRVTQAIETDIVIGQKVRDRASGLEGIAIEKATFMNGCVSFGVVPKCRPTDLINAKPDTAWLSAVRLEVVNDGLNADVPKPTTTPTTRATGGPASRVTNRC